MPSSRFLHASLLPVQYPSLPPIFFVYVSFLPVYFPTLLLISFLPSCMLFLPMFFLYAVPPSCSTAFFLLSFLFLLPLYHCSLHASFLRFPDISFFPHFLCYFLLFQSSVTFLCTSSFPRCSSCLVLCMSPCFIHSFLYNCRFFGYAHSSICM